MVWDMKNDRVLQWVRDSYHVLHRYTQVSAETKQQTYMLQVRKAVFRNSGLGMCAIQQAEVVEEVAAGDIQEAQRRSMWLSYANFRYEKATTAHERKPDKHSIEAVGILKKATDRENKYLIYNINGEPDYIFRSSSPMAWVTTDMDQYGPKHPL